MTESALWTTLPNGVGGNSNSLRASVFVSPRLVTQDGQPGRLQDFPLFVHWPLIAHEVTVRLAIDGFGELAASRDPLSPAPDPQLWDALFARVPVVSHRFDDLSTRRIRSYPVGNVLTAALGLYARVAGTSPTTLADPSTINTLAGKLGSDLVDSAGDPAALDSQAQAVANDPNASAELAFLLAERFYTRPNTRDAYRRTPDPSHTPSPVPLPDVDFHAAVAFLADYPQLPSPARARSRRRRRTPQPDAGVGPGASGALRAGAGDRALRRAAAAVDGLRPGPAPAGCPARVSRATWRTGCSPSTGPGSWSTTSTWMARP